MELQLVDNNVARIGLIRYLITITANIYSVNADNRHNINMKRTYTWVKLV